jgi:hypothetical protein
MTRATLRPQALVGLLAFLFTLGVDLSSKALAVAASPPLVVVYDHRHVGDGVSRILLSLAAVAAVAGGSVVAARRGIGRLWGAWVCVGLMLGGIAGNGISHLVWSRGTPDFVWLPGRYVWNLADFAIGLGLMGGFVSVAVAALFAAARDLRAARGAAEA